MINLRSIDSPRAIARRLNKIKYFLANYRRASQHLAAMSRMVRGLLGLLYLRVCVEEAQTRAHISENIPSIHGMIFSAVLLFWIFVLVAQPSIHFEEFPFRSVAHTH